MEGIQLKKPVFSTIDQIAPAKHCYNVYATVVEAKVSERDSKGGKVPVIEGVVGDETACANFRFVGEQFAWVKAGKVIAIRNGLSSVVDEHILLEVDKFGRVTEEAGHKIDKVKNEKNISSTPYVKKVRDEKRDNRDNRGPHRERNDRGEKKEKHAEEKK